MPGADGSRGVVIGFDAAADAAVRRMWAALADAGASRSMLAPGIRPHLSLALGEPDEDAVAAIAAATAPFDVALSHVGVFADTGVVFLGVTPTAALLDLHRRVAAVVPAGNDPIGAWYRPDRWVPHVTLAFGLSREGIGAALDGLGAPPGPLVGRAGSLAIVQGDESGWTAFRSRPLRPRK